MISTDPDHITRTNNKKLILVLLCILFENVTLKVLESLRKCHAYLRKSKLRYTFVQKNPY